MVDERVVETALAMLSVAAAELMEARHAEAVGPLPESATNRARRFSELRRVGEDVAALAVAAEVLLRRMVRATPS